MAETDPAPRWELRATARRLPYSALTWAADNDTFPPMHRAAARREMRRRDRQDAQWLADFMTRLAITPQRES